MIKQVQKNSQQTYDKINRISFSGYSKTFIYFGYNPLAINLVPLLEEYYFDGFWIKPDSLRIIVKALRKVTPDSGDMNIEDIGPLPNPFSFTYDPSALGMQDAEEEGEKIWPLYPFAMGADTLYTYWKDSEISFGPNRIISIRAMPKESNIRAVNGLFHIDADRNVVVGSDILFNEAASILKGRGIENHRVKTKKILMYSSYWLPMNIEEEWEIKIWGIKAKIHRTIEFKSYFVNPEPTDTTQIKNKKVVYNRDPEMERELFPPTNMPNRLTKEEQDRIIKAIEDKFSSLDLYKELLESEEIAQEAIKLGLEQRVGRYFHFAQKLGNYLHFNRVEGLRVSYGLNLTNLVFHNFILSFYGGYGFKDKRLKGNISILKYIDDQKKVFLEGNIYNTIGYEENRVLISTGKNTFTSLLYKGDYRDYYYKEGGSVGLGLRATDNLALKLSYISHKETNAFNHTKFSIFKYNTPFRINPEIDEGIYRGIKASIYFRTFNWDSDVIIEHTNTNWLSSDFAYSTIKANLRRQFRPTYHSNVYITTTAGYAFDYVTPQRWFDFGGRTFLNYFGNLRGVDYKRFTGDCMAKFVMEYTIKGGAFYDRGMDIKLLKVLKFTIWNGLGWSSLSNKIKNRYRGLNTPMNTTDGLYHEIGVGIGDILNIFRIDFIRNNDGKNNFFVHLNVLQ